MIGLIQKFVFSPIYFYALMVKLSRYSLPFSFGNQYFVYNSRTNSFFELSESGFSLLNSYKDSNKPESLSGSTIDDSNDFLEFLIEKKILINDDEDEKYVCEQIIKNNVRSYSSYNLDLTVLPTNMCNLACPYCFEIDKPTGLMSDEVIAHLIQFIKLHQSYKTLSLTWFGGEPLLGFEVIKKILSKLNEEEVKIDHHSIVTNGTLLTQDVSEFFSRNSLNSIQITLDGFKDTHDSKRKYHNGDGSFDKIIDNVSQFVKICPETYVSFRVNVDNTNCDEYIQVYEFIKEKFKGCKVGVYAGILRANKGCEDSLFFTSRDHLAFNEKLLEKGLPVANYPSLCDKGCCSTRLSSYVIGAKGEIYKCWEHVGIREKIVGNLLIDKLSNPILIHDLMIHGNCLNDTRCKACGFLPICTGGCAIKRLENYYIDKGIEQGKKFDLCSIYFDEDLSTLSNFLYRYYQKSK